MPHAALADDALDTSSTSSQDTPLPKSLLEVINHEGDTKIQWNQGNVSEVEAARRHFDYLLGKGHSLFRMGPGEARQGQIREFDPTAERIISVPPMVGG